ncbi:MAG TPA: hypothetical protein VN726_00790 [Hanamia sp.]|nr:hypothetical protein [Hanamia sp.]
MEVHHHPDLHHKKKNFKEYFLEFLMIFLAVTLGFFAENIRERVANNSKEKEFISSFKEDLISDTVALQNVIPENQRQFEKLDSLYTLLELARNNKPFAVNRLYYLNFRYAYGLVYFKANERTISQVKSTGAFALIKNKASRDSLTVYYYSNENDMPINVQGLKEWTDNLDRLSEKIFDYKHVKTFWFNGGANIFLSDSLHLGIDSDKQLLKEYSNKVRALMMMVNILETVEQGLLTSAKNLIALLNKEYHLSNQ